MKLQSRKKLGKTQWRWGDRGPFYKSRAQANQKAIKSLKLECDKLWSLLIRSNGKCEICGTTQNLQAHHMITRARLSTRWMEENGVCLCSDHHNFNNDISAHNATIPFAKWYEEEYGPERYYWLLKESKKHLKLTVEYMLKLRDDLNAALNR